MPCDYAAELRAMGVREDVIANTRIDGKLLADCKPKKRSDAWPYRSKWEAMYAMLLEDQERSGVILGWQYEDIRLRLTAPSVDTEGKAVRAITYTPDFIVWLPDGRLRFVEIKGYRRTKDINRFKLAKDKFRHAEFVMLSWTKGGWKVVM